MLAVLALGTQAPLGLFVSMLKGSQRFDILNASDLISTAVYAVLVITVFTHLATLPALATIALIVTVIRLGLPALYVKREARTCGCRGASSVAPRSGTCSTIRASRS